jgi:mono/diheme cytochrome c family protein
MRYLNGFALLVLCGALNLACGDDEGGIGNNPDAAVNNNPDANTNTADAAPADAGTDLIARGQYIVDVLAVCGDCHTPRLQNGMPDMDNYLAGAECFIDVMPANDSAGCLHTKNLTNHSTGLMNRTDAQIKDMFLNGMRPNGQALHSVMPYYQFHNMSDDDANAIVAYLRTVTGVDHAVPAHEAPWDTAPAQPATPVDFDDVPDPTTGPNLESARRGRYIAGVFSCLECHTPELAPTAPTPIDMTKPFAGGRTFPGIPSPPFTTDTVLSPNITQHATGIDGWNASDVYNVIKNGMDPDGDVICPPMPAGPNGNFAGMTDDDASDVANYIMSLPGVDNAVSVIQCSLQ